MSAIRPQRGMKAAIQVMLILGMIEADKVPLGGEWGGGALVPSVLLINTLQL